MIEKKLFQGGLCLILGVGGLAAQESGPRAEVVELREVISKMVEVKSQTSAEKSDWAERKEAITDLLELHQKERKLLSEELEEAGTSAQPFDEKKQAAEAAIAELKVLRQETSQVVVKERERSLSLLNRLPAPLQEELLAERDTLEGWRPGDEPRKALQAILGVVGQATQFNRRVTVVNEERGGEEVAVLYLGLARAYYASPAGKAGIGEPGATGWEWTERDALHGAVRNALDQLDEKRPPELVKLPLQVRGKEAGQ
ncbi:MAG: DUF3450 family protein [Verrucomicrobiales bacterium]